VRVTRTPTAAGMEVDVVASVGPGLDATVTSGFGPKLVPFGGASGGSMR
jgi:hypothetical protein